MEEGRADASGPPSTDSFEWKSHAEFYLNSAYGEFAQEHRRGGTFGLSMMEVDQGAIEMIDPAFPELVIARLRTHAPFEYDFGDGWRRARSTPEVVDIQPAFQDCGFRLPAVRFIATTAKSAIVGGLLEEVGAAPAALDAITGEFRELPQAAELVDRLWRSMNVTGAASTLLTDGLFMTLVGQLLEASGQGALPATLPRARDRRLVRAEEYIEAHLGTALTVGELAKVATLSRSGFARAFRRAYGEPVWSWVQGRRVERALELLRGTALPIAEVAERCGFASQSHLTSVLRERHGVTPGAVRRG